MSIESSSFAQLSAHLDRYIYINSTVKVPTTVLSN